MAKHRTHSIEFKRQIAQDFIAGETLHALANRHDISRNLIRIWVRKFEAGAFDGVTMRVGDPPPVYAAEIEIGLPQASVPGATRIELKLRVCRLRLSLVKKASPVSLCVTPNGSV